MVQPFRMIFGLFLASFVWLGAGAAHSDDRGRDFDFYVLSLSWSPTFCATGKAAENRDQCGTARAFGLIVHGLWPQYERGYPQSCPSDQPSRVPSSLGRQFLDIMPSMGLIGHQWRKHGTCSGLSQQDYFSAMRKAYEGVTIPPALRHTSKETRVAPDEIERQFVSANQGLSPRGIAVTCEAGKLDEVQICLTKDLRFRACPQVDGNGCRQGRISVPPID